MSSPADSPSPADAPATVRIRLDLSYDGTDFAGWATQPALRTVQGVLEGALGTVLRCPPPRLTVAGRTDAGVHARGQVAHVDLDTDVWEGVRGRMDSPPGPALVRRLAGLLPADVVVHRATPAPAGFDARFGALYRRYRYRLADDAVRVDPLRRAYVVRHKMPLDEAAMAAAARSLVGQHDFAAFCRPRPGATTIRTLQVLDVDRPSAGADEGLVVATVQADAFCHTMVRSLVGALLAVGEGRRPPSWPGEVLSGQRRDGGTMVAPAHGLTLEEIVYPPDDELAARAVRTRARREALTGPATAPTRAEVAP
jgi:tRNA pseudouridine38-40 synthase